MHIAGLKVTYGRCDFFQESEQVSEKLKGLPFGIMQPRSDLELKPLWSSSSLRSKVRLFCKFWLESNIFFIARRVF